MSLSCTVVSLVPFDINEEKPGLFPPRYHIKASDMKIPSVLHVSNASHYVYLDQDRKSLRVPDPSDQVARAIVDDYVTSQLGVDDNSRPALFWIPAELNADQVKITYVKEIGVHIASQRNWMLNVARMADNDWNRYHQHNVVSDFQRKCAEFIGWKAEDHDWMSPLILETAKCPACQSQVPKGAIICSICRTILDESAAKEKGLKFA